MDTIIPNEDILLSRGGELYVMKPFTLKDLGINPRIFAYWKDKELLPMLPKFVSARFNFIEAVWILTLENMRKFGLSIEWMKVATQQLIIDAEKNKLADEIIHNEISDPKEVTSKEGIQALKATLKNPGQMKKLRKEINYFSQLVKYVLYQKKEAGIIINESHEVRGYYNDTLDEKENLQYLLTQMHLFIPLRPIINTLVLKEIEKGTFNIPRLSEDENRILKELRRKDVDEIEIIKDKRTIVVKSKNKKDVSNTDLGKMILGGTLEGFTQMSSRGNGMWYVETTKKVK